MIYRVADRHCDDDDGHSSVLHVTRAGMKNFISLLVWLCLGLSVQTWSADAWPALQDRNLEVVEGSVLDFSGLHIAKPAGASGWVHGGPDGHLHFASDPRPERFLCASLVPSPPNGGIPDKIESDRWVRQLTRTGYNLVRLHYIDATLMAGRKGDFDYDPEALDRLHYLMGRLKAAGIYWIVDGLTSENGAYGDVQPHRWVNRYNLKARLYYDPSALEHWKRLVTSLWGTVNPYTGLAPLNDPATLGMVLVNEGGLAFSATLGGGYPKELNVPFGIWLKSRYPDDGALKAAWGDEKSMLDHVGQSAEVPSEIRGSGKRARDFAAFVADSETALYRAMEVHVRSRGFRGLVTSYDNWNFNHADAVRGALEWVDMHAYQSLPSRYAEPGSVLPQTSIFDDVGRYGRVLANARHWGKPFTVTEYGQPFWNQWRHESTAWMPALAAFQDWDAICQFAELPVLLEYAESGPPRRLAIYPFGVGADPIARAGERLAALLFLRGDVASSRGRLLIDLEPESLFRSGSVWGQTPESLSRMALVIGTGLDRTGVSASVDAKRDIHMPLDSGLVGWVEKARNVALKKGFLLGKDPLAQLKTAALLPTTNRSDLSAGLFETDTGQMLFDASGKKLSIVSERTVAFTLRSGAATGGGVDLSSLSSPATVAVGAVDNQVIAHSHRMLVWVLTDAMNTGMAFSDAERTTLKSLGRFPPRIRPVTGKLAIKNNEAGKLKVWAIDQTGHRVAEVPSRVQAGSLRFAIDNVMPGYGPVTYFEVADH